MIRDITLGQYYPGESVIHRLDPRVKIMATLLYIVALFVVKDFTGFIAAVVLLEAVIILSKVPRRYIWRGLRPVLLIIAFTLIVNIFMIRGEVLWQFGILHITREGLRMAAFVGIRLVLLIIAFTLIVNIFMIRGEVLWQFGILHITREGLRMAAFVGIRLVLLIIGSTMLTLTTRPIGLTDGIEALLSPFKRIGLPAHELAMMMTIALRFIPTLLEETDKIIKAQQARGADFESGNIMRRARALVPILVPLFISAFRIAQDLAMAMEARCYGGDVKRTRMNAMKFARRDLIATIIFCVFLALVVLQRVLL